MAGLLHHPDEVAGFSVPVHRALTEHILLGGAPRPIPAYNSNGLGIIGAERAAAPGETLRNGFVGSRITGAVEVGEAEAEHEHHELDVAALVSSTAAGKLPASNSATCARTFPSRTASSSSATSAP